MNQQQLDGRVPPSKHQQVSALLCLQFILLVLNAPGSALGTRRRRRLMNGILSCRAAGDFAAIIIISPEA